MNWKQLHLYQLIHEEKKKWGGRGQDESDFHLSEEWSKGITTSLIGLDAAPSTRCCTHLKNHKENSPMVLNQMGSPLPINKGCKFNPVQVHDLCYPSDKDTTTKIEGTLHMFLDYWSKKISRMKNYFAILLDVGEPYPLMETTKAPSQYQNW